MRLCINMFTILIFLEVFVLGIFTLTPDFIELQANLCPYIPLCTRRNSTYFKGNPHDSNRIPCCQECSCEADCVALGSCCPDYIYPQNFNETLVNNTKELAHTSKGLVNVPDSEPSCVRTHYGLLNNDDGYKMLDSCPRDYPENATKTRCETPFDYMSDDLYEHIPVSSTLTGAAFKNQFCRLCQASETESIELWEVWLNCAGNAHFRIGNLTSPLDLIRKTFQMQLKICSIVFKRSNASTGLNMTEICTREEMITTCGDDFQNTDTQTACNEYTWPITVRSGTTLQKYRNYACMVCNGVDFQEYCLSFDYREMRHFSASLNIEIPMLYRSEPRNKQNTENDTTNVLTGRHFPANSQCREGFVFDKQTNVCRQMFCPNLFYAKNGKCEPVFVVMANVVYDVILEFLLPHSFNNAPVQIVQTALFTSFSEILVQRIGVSNHELSLWTNSRSADRIAENITYVVLFSVSCQFAEGNYYAILEFVHHLIHVERQVPVTILMENFKANANVGIKFASSVDRDSNRMIKALEPLKSEELFVVKQISEMKTLNLATTSRFSLTKVSFCYTVRLSEDEIRLSDRARSSIEIINTKQILSGHNLIRDYTEPKEKTYYVCLNDALTDHSERFNYIMNATSSVDSMFEWPKKATTRPESVETPRGIGTGGSDSTDHTQSFVALISSLVVIALMVSIRVGLKKLRKNSQTVDDAGDETNAPAVVENIPMSTF